MGAYVVVVLQIALPFSISTKSLRMQLKHYQLACTNPLMEREKKEGSLWQQQSTLTWHIPRKEMANSYLVLLVFWQWVFWQVLDQPCLLAPQQEHIRQMRLTRVIPPGSWHPLRWL